MPPKKDEVDQYEQAACAIWEADYLLIVAGPAFYEPASKTCFADERCDPLLIQRDPNKFFGFWGTFFNRYNERSPHDSYSILRKWRDNYFDITGQDLRKKAAAPAKGKEEEEVDTLQRCYVVSSSVDGSFPKVGFPSDEVYEIQGSVMTWQCWTPCKPQVWNVDSRFTFEIDAMHEARPIKYVDDDRQAFIPEVYTIEDTDEEPPEPPQVLPRDAKGNVKPMSEREKRALAKEMHDKMMKRLNRATVVQLLPEHQDLVPNLHKFKDLFTPTPTSSHQTPVTFTFVKLEPESEEDPDELGLEAPAEPPSIGIPSGPEQPYIMRPRVNHTLSHTLALDWNKFAFQEGVLEETDPQAEYMVRYRLWQEQQKFFSPDQPGVTRQRMKHIFYRISFFILDAGNSTAPPPLFDPASESPEPTEDDDVDTLPPLSSRGSSRQQVASKGSSRSVQDQASDGAGSLGIGGEDEPALPPCEQGEKGRYYFSYVPITKTHADPDNNFYDTVRIDFPHEEGKVHLPKRGKVSVIAECCILPEPEEGGKKADDDGKKKKKAPEGAPAKKVEEPTKLDPILEPTQYVAFQLVARVPHDKERRQGSASVISVDTKATPRTDPKEPEENKEDFEYRTSTIKNHILKIGVTQTAKRSIKYIELECPVLDPTLLNPNDFGVQRKLVGEPRELPQTSGRGAKGPPPAVILATPKKKRKPRPVPNHQLCVECHDLARPNVLMDPKKDQRCIPNPNKKPYQMWETAMTKRQKNEGMTLCILEVGCEKKPCGARKIAEKVFKATKASGKAYHLRIATEDLNTKKGGEDAKAIAIVDNVVNAISNIDRRVTEKLKAKQAKG